MKKRAAPPKTGPSGDGAKPFDPLEFSRQIVGLMGEAQPVISELLEKYKHRGHAALQDAPIDPMHLNHAAAEFWGHYMRHPSHLVELQLKYWEDMSHLWTESTRKFMGESAHAIAKPELGDRRFRDPVWTENVAFDFIKQSYLLTRNWVQTALNDAEHLPDADRQKLEFYTKQFLDALAPNNFAMTNPEVIKETLRTGGDNLVKGLHNLIEDMKRGDGELKISTTRPEAFEIGKNIATTAGKVIFRNELMELIQYAPSTENVSQIPLLIVPPWINKYYILDLRPDNSLIKFAVDQGYTVFIISWVNPDKSFAKIMFDDYMQDGLLTALDVVENVTGTKTTNVVGYCIGGTLTTMTLAWLQNKRQAKRINSATLLTTLIDFDQAGDMKVFISEPQLDELEHHMKTQGYLEAQALQKTFSILRANDMIWSFVINNYMLGREPFPFDILYWNEDSTNLPAAFHTYYLRHLYLRNDLIKPDKLTINGVKIDIRKIKTPLYFLSTREDHIAPWKATYAGAQILAEKNKDLTFVLAASGHVAGVVNPPTSGKYGYWTQHDMNVDADDWLDHATYADGSWWTGWSKWLKSRSGDQIPARTIGNKKYPALADAPGTYVKKRII